MQHYFFRKLLAFIIVHLIQREVDIFKDIVWNIQRIRNQKRTFRQVFQIIFMISQKWQITAVW